MNDPYLIINIGLFILVLYAFTFLLSGLNIIRKKTHRQIWNILLLLTFFTTAILGLILAIQVNFKLKIPFIKQLLIWHVDFGIGMVLIAIFHLTWHWSYYVNIFKIKNEQKIQIINEPFENKKKSDSRLEVEISIPVLILGLTSVITQIVLLREFLAVFRGNELVTGLFLFAWMTITGLGAYFGRNIGNIRLKISFLFYQLVFTGLIPFVTITILDTLKNIVFEPGIAIGPFQIAGSAIVLLLPFCLLSGFSFTYFATFLSRQYEKNKTDIAYAFEAAGSLAGGLLFSLLLVYILTTLQILALLFFINTVAAFFYRKRIRNKVFRILPLVFCTIVMTVSFSYPLDSLWKSFLFPNQKITYLKDSPYGSLTVTEVAGQLNFYENNILLFTTENTIANEEAVHYAMLQHPSPKRVLIISGGITGLVKEIEKYSVDSIDYVEINPWLIDIANRFTGNLDSQKLRILMQDARLYIKETNRKYDVVLINLPAPSTAQLNRYYTLEFFRELRSKLNTGSIISLTLPSTANYLSKEATMVNSIVFNTLQKVFKEVVIIQGEQDYFIASDRKLNLNIAEMAEERGLNNEYVNPFYIDDNSIKERNDYIRDNLLPDAPVNHDFTPVAYFYQIGFWLSQFSINPVLLSVFAVILIFLVTYFLSRLNPVSVGLFTAGFTGSSLEIIIILAFQIIYGYVYQTIGIIITVFMAGLALGALLRNRFLRIVHYHNYRIIQLIIAAFAFLLPVILLLMQKYNIYTSLIQVGFILLMLGIALLTGILFSMATSFGKKEFSKTAASLYSVDLAGSALGALLTSILLIPVFGLIKYSLLLGTLNILAAGVYLFKKVSVQH